MTDTTKTSKTNGKPNKKSSQTEQDPEPLFLAENGSTWYLEKKGAQDVQSLAEKAYWNSLYIKHANFLDDDFIIKFPEDPMARLWELTLCNFLDSHKPAGLEMVRLTGMESKPDFCFSLDGKKFFLEATTSSPGSRPELNASLIVKQKTEHGTLYEAKSICIHEYNESFCSAIREKGITKYNSGYKKYMLNHSDACYYGFIIGVSTIKIPFYNHPRNIQNELGCLWGLGDTHYLVDPATKTMAGPFIPLQKDFKKQSNKQNSTISKNFFEENRHISAVLVSYEEVSFFPDADQHIPINWKNVKNEFCLIHNPFANVPLPRSILSVYKEYSNFEMQKLHKVWKDTTLGQICTLHYGKGISKESYNEKGETSIYGTGGLIGYTSLPSQTHGPSIIIGRKGSIKSPNLISKRVPFSVIDTAYYLETKEDIEYLYYLIDSIDLTKYNEASGVPSLNRETFYGIKIKLPDLATQRKIAAILRTWDEAIDNINLLISLRQARNDYLKNILLGDKEGNPLTSKRLGDICKIFTGKKDVNEGNSHGVYPFYTCAKNVTFSDSYSFDTEAILISGNGVGVGYTHYFKGKFEAYQRTYILSEFKNITPRYVLHWLRKHLRQQIMKEKQDGAMPYIKIDLLYNFKVTIPTSTQQKIIADTLDIMDGEIMSLEKTKLYFQNQKRGLMQKLLTGQWHVQPDTNNPNIKEYQPCSQ